MPLVSTARNPAPSLAGRSSEERRLIAALKRLSERFKGDAEFRRGLIAGEIGAGTLVARYGITIDPRELLPLYHPDFTGLAPEEWGGRWPLASLWFEHAKTLRSYADTHRELGRCARENPAFDAWRQRQIRRCNNELGASGSGLSHPILAFELSAGCTMGCWFCGISAEQFRGNFRYTAENAQLWQEMLAASVALFGPAAQQGFCYWGTDPCDNPDYADFIEDFLRATGTLPQTTTAAPLKNIVLTRRILALQDAYGSVPDRFSILNLKTLDRVHATFTADELLNVELVLQNPESDTPRTFAGRARERTPAIRAESESRRRVADATIACVSGFLVNMVDRTLRLVTPVPASERWPQGYRTYETRPFTSAADFRTGIEDLIARHMPSAPRPDHRLRFRADLAYRPGDDGFELVSRGARFTFTGSREKRRLGELIHAGAHTAGGARAALIEGGCDLFVAANLVQQLFDRGLLEETVVLDSVAAMPPRAEQPAA
ncbi:radical SAM family RiPP maturation amino acid epimerase [Methylobacterium sp. J-078]|uniref:radical SAM family RiPP maturation amino acid epimerase n=1 Tax=Methylobacterium sp. J-078 TaxID=2836657 RepID=UPI001FBA9DF1|nr:radical SAM family RiPP maturation amino acid epimerase [Methylobacterium sp. J-078]MCJ2045950.1 radical SAM family RiPP maturation amino acid epimerase [Methylobacterium sp. J-078]